MKKHLCLLVLLLVLALCSAAHPGYAMAAANEVEGQSALHLPNGAAINAASYSFVDYTEASGARYVAAYSYDERGGYHAARSQPLPAGWSLDSAHSGDNLLLKNEAEHLCVEFLSNRRGDWKLASVQADDDFFFFPGAIMSNAYVIDYAIYAGDLPDMDLRTIDLSALPHSLAEASALLDSANWRVVNNPIATDRLRLRDAPGGKELGRYYNGTPVQILGEDGEWSHVRIGHVEGYVMSAYLAPGDRGVALHSLLLYVREEWTDMSLPLYTQPNESSAVVAQVKNSDFTPWAGELLCGTAGDGWLHVLLLRDGISGYIQEKYLWPGNG